jgi:hypothetical protein
MECPNCKGQLEANLDSLECPYCGHNLEISAEVPVVQEELDFKEALEAFKNPPESSMVRIETCPGCQAEVTFPEDVQTGECEFCGTSMTLKTESRKVMDPQYIIPFALNKEAAKEEFIKWVRSRWFAPNALKKLARITESLKGVYYPFWTFDSQTDTDYNGSRGDYYYVNVSYTDSEGKRKTRRERRTRWSHRSGRVDRFFDDLLVVASRSLPEKLTQRLDEWDLGKLVKYKTDYLQGLHAESYSKDIEEGFVDAKSIMQGTIRNDIKRDIGGDEQRIYSSNTHYSAITFKYLLLPVWTAVYKYKAKYYQVLVNAQTGEVEGFRPYSWVKITLAALAGAALIAGGIYLFNYFQ